MKAAAAAECPRISYSQALSARFVYHGEGYTVETCPASILTSYLTACVSLSDKMCGKRAEAVRGAVREALGTLANDDTDLARWYALDVLLSSNVPVPLLENVS